MANVKVITEASAQGEGFSEAEIVASRTHPDGYIGERGGFKFFNTQIDFKMGDFEYKGSPAEMPNQHGQRI